MQRFTFFLITIIMFTSINLFATDYYWVGGSGDWSDINHWATTSGGSTKHIQTPSATDNVIFDANSMSASAIVNLNSQIIFCKNFNVESINNTLQFIGICNNWRIYGGMKLNTLFNPNGAKLYFEALSGIQDIKTNSKKIFTDMYFRGTASWKLLDSLDCVNIYLESGNINTNSKKLKAHHFSSNTSNSRSLLLGSSEIFVYSWNVTGAGYSVNAGTSVITILQPYNNFQHNSTTNQTYYDLIFLGNGYLHSNGMHITFRKVEFKGDGGITGNNTYDSLVFAIGGDYSIGGGTVQTIILDIVAHGSCKDLINIHSYGSFALFSKSNGTITCDYVALLHIHAGGGAVFYANAGHDLGDNIGWIMQAPISRDLYWVGGDGMWADTSHWSLSSGGPGGECVPTIVDDVFIDVNSYVLAADTNNKLTLQKPGICHDFKWNNNVAGKLLINDTLNIAGSCFLGNLLNIKPKGWIKFISNDLGETIQTNNIQLHDQEIYFTGDGSWQLLDSLNNGEGNVYHFNGHLKTLGQYVHTDGFFSSDHNAKELSFGSSILDIVHEFYLFQDSLTVYPNTSHIRMLGDEPIVRTIDDHPVTLYNLTFVKQSAKGSINNNFTRFNKISYYQNMELKGQAISDTLYFDKGHDYIFNNRTDSIVKKLIANGDCIHTISMREKLALDIFKFKMAPTATTSVSYVNFRGSHIIGSGIYTALNSGDVGMNQGWVFSVNSINHYWVGGQGNWQNQAHWSYSSGGVGGACIPMIYDDVFFDANSFSSSHDTVSVDLMNAYCRNMDWSNATNTPLFTVDSSYVSFISGSVKLIHNMDYQNGGETFFVWEQNNKTIDMADQYFDEKITFCDSGSWTLLDTLWVMDRIIHNKGKLIANQYLIGAENYIAVSSEPKTLSIINSEVHIISKITGMFLWNQNNQTHLLAANSHIKFFGGGRLHTQGVGLTVYNNVSYLDSIRLGVVYHKSPVTNQFNKIFFQSDGSIYGENTMDTLIFSKGGDYQFESGFDQYITHDWQANADCYGTISITGRALNPVSIQSNVHMMNGNVLFHSVYLKDLTAIGSGTFSILNGVDLGGNSSNWTITPTVSRTLYWVNEYGDWFDTTHWSMSSGGPGGECIPTYKDDVFFDTASFTIPLGVVLASYPTDCHDMIWRWTPVNPKMDFNYDVNIYGSIALGDTMTIGSTVLKMRALDTTNFIKTSSHTIKSIDFVSTGGWYLMDDLSIDNGVNHINGSFRSMGKNITASYYKSTYNTVRKIDIRNSVLSMSYYISLRSDKLNLLSDYSHIKFDNTTGTLMFTVLGAKSLYFNEISFLPVNKIASKITNATSVKQFFNKVTINNDAQIIGQNDFDTLIFRAGNTYELDYLQAQTVNDYWFLRGNNCFALNLQSTKKNMQADVHSLSAVVSGDFINMRDIRASGGAMFYAGSFSTDISNNSGWIFSNGPQYVYGLGPDVTFNLGGSTTLNTVNFNGGPNTSYLWSTGSTNPTISVNQTGWYYVSVTYAGGCIVTDSIFVGCDLKMNYNITHNKCNGDSFGLIQALIPDPSFQYLYQWSTGDTLDYADSLQAGQYIVLVSADSGLCAVVDTLTVNEPPPVICPQSDTAFCIEDSVLLDLGNFQTYVWDDNYQGQYRWMSVPDTFIISVEDLDGCWSVPDTISIREDLPPLVNLGPDTTICLHESVLLDAGSGYDTYLWSSNSAMSNLQVYYTGIYWVRVQEKTCVVSDTIELLNCPPKFIVPNVFTPNGDGYNDVFNIDYQNIWEFEVRIYDRWGTKVFESADLQNPWNGKVNGRESAEGVYFWQIIYQEYNGKGGGYEDKMVRGTVTLFR